MRALITSASILTAVAASTAFGTAAAADVITQWNFNGPSATTVPGGANSPFASTGFGTASLIGGATGENSFGSGAVNGGSSDPAGSAPPNYAWQTTTYPAQGTASGTAGVQFNVSTLGYDSVVVRWDHRHSNTSSRWWQFQYSLDGSSFSAAGLANDGLFAGTTGDTWFNNRTVDLSAIAGVANNANFAFRIVAVFAPGTNAYAASQGTSSYAGGTARFDMVTIEGSEIPSPGALALLSLAGLLGKGRRR